MLREFSVGPRIAYAGSHTDLNGIIRGVHYSVKAEVCEDGIEIAFRLTRCHWVPWQTLTYAEAKKVLSFGYVCKLRQEFLEHLGVREEELD